MPGARKNSMNATPCRVRARHLQGSRATAATHQRLRGSRSGRSSGLLDNSVAALKAHHEQLKKTWGITCDAEVSIPEVPLNDFVKRLTAHVQ